MSNQLSALKQWRGSSGRGQSIVEYLAVVILITAAVIAIGGSFQASVTAVFNNAITLIK